MKLTHLPLRLAAGGYILNSGLDKLGSDDEAAEGYHRTASGAYPFLDQITPRVFVKGLAATEITLGTALVLPVLPRRLVAAGFTLFSAALVGMYLRTPALRRGRLDPRPSPAGIGVAKDIIMLGAATSYLLDTLRRRSDDD